MTDTPIAHGVYRSPGRTAEVVARPSWRLLLSPLGRAAGLVLVLTLPVLLLNGIESLLPSGTRLVPMFEHSENAIAIALLGSPIVLGVLIARRVAPRWRALRCPARWAYVATLLLVQLGVVGAAEVAIFASGGGLHLFKPVYRSSASGPNGRTAHVYSGGLLGCTHDVYVSGPLSPTMTKTVSVNRSRCNERIHVRWNQDASLQVVDEDGNVVESQPTDLHLFPLGC
jgi:hypothetical protein